MFKCFIQYQPDDVDGDDDDDDDDDDHFGSKLDAVKITINKVVPTILLYRLIVIFPCTLL